MRMMIIILMGHQCKKGIVWGPYEEGEGEKKRVLKKVTKIHEDSIIKPMKQCLEKKGKKKANFRTYNKK
jgi:hypothetical protein